MNNVEDDATYNLFLTSTYRDKPHLISRDWDVAYGKCLIIQSKEQAILYSKDDYWLVRIHCSKILKDEIYITP